MHILKPELATLAVAALSVTLGTGTAGAHTLAKAEDQLYDRGYYDVTVERATLPYSFQACKRGTRYHIHVDYYGRITEKDAIGHCGGRQYSRQAYEAPPPVPAYRDTYRDPRVYSLDRPWERRRWWHRYR